MGSRRQLWLGLWLVVVVLAVAVAIVIGGNGFPSSSASRGEQNNDPVVVAAGDIADCKNKNANAEATAKLVEKIDGTVIALGDTAYNSGTAREFANCYDPTWGRFKARTHPVPGNHEYGSPGAAPYYAYFGAAAGDPKKGYYSFDVGKWHIVVLNSNCDKIDGCGSGSPQERWLREDLAKHPAQCTMAVWHHPLFSSSGGHGNYTMMRPIWQDLYDAGADLVLNGHAHNYERVAPMTPQGKRDPQRGIREFVVGTGGRDHRQLTKIAAFSEAHNDNTYGVLKLTLHPSGYDWQFVPEAGQTYTDSGSASCH